MRDAAIVAGTGAGQPLGIVNSDALSQVTKETGQLNDTIVAENVINMFSRMTAAGKRRAVWLVNGECWPQLFGMALIIGPTGYPLYMPPGGLSQSPYGTILGRPVIEIEQCPALGDVGEHYLRGSWAVSLSREVFRYSYEDKHTYQVFE